MSDIKHKIDLNITSCDLAECWDMMKPHIEKYVGDNKFTCIPYLSEGQVYDITSVFIKAKENEFMKKNQTFMYIGRLDCLIDKAATHEAWHKGSDLVDVPQACPFSAGLNLMLYDMLNKKKIIFKANGFYKLAILESCNIKEEITLNSNSAIRSSATSSIYLVTEIIVATTTELWMYVGNYSRCYYLGNPQPIMFKCQKFKYNKNGKIISKTMEHLSSERTMWVKLEGGEEQHSVQYK